MVPSCLRRLELGTALALPESGISEAGVSVEDISEMTTSGGKGAESGLVHRTGPWPIILPCNALPRKLLPRAISWLLAQSAGLPPLPLSRGGQIWPLRQASLMLAD